MTATLGRSRGENPRRYSHPRSRSVRSPLSIPPRWESRCAGDRSGRSMGGRRSGPSIGAIDRGGGRSAGRLGGRPGGAQRQGSRGPPTPGTHGRAPWGVRAADTPRLRGGGVTGGEGQLAPGARGRTRGSLRAAGSSPSAPGRVPGGHAPRPPSQVCPPRTHPAPAWRPVRSRRGRARSPRPHPRAPHPRPGCSERSCEQDVPGKSVTVATLTALRAGGAPAQTRQKVRAEPARSRT